MGMIFLVVFAVLMRKLFSTCSLNATSPNQVWCLCYSWLMSPMACASDPTSHFLQHSGVLD
ncbi:hypothetical protein ACS0TY_022127 [Phlomoides rotata]